MKKTTIIAGTIVICFILIAGFFCYAEYQFTTYIDRTIKSYTKISNYSIIQKAHNNHECYAKISITEKDGDKLLSLHSFKHCYTEKVIAGLVQQDYIKDCCDCWYCLDDKSEDIYAYTLCCLSEDKKQLEIYRCFGD